MDKTSKIPLSGSRQRRLLLSAVFIFNFAAVLSGTSLPHSQQNLFQKFFAPYLLCTRLNQNWALFVPEPRKNAVKYHVDIVFKNGQTSVWQRPYPPNWDFFARHLSYSFQKWDLAANYLDSPGPIRKDLANYIQHRYWNDANPPVTITLVKSKAKWPPPNESGFVQSDEGLLQWWDQVLFVYHVDEKRME